MPQLTSQKYSAGSNSAFTPKFKKTTSSQMVDNQPIGSEAMKQPKFLRDESTLVKQGSIESTFQQMSK